MRVSVIIVAAGSSQRMGFDKLMADLSGQTVLQRSVNAFLSCAAFVDEIIVVTDRARWETLDWSSAPPAISRHHAEGGAERVDSVAAGLQCVSEEIDLVAVHDGARPLIHAEAIEDGCRVALDCGAAVLAQPIVDTLKRATRDGKVGEAVEREDLWGMQTPQIFGKQILLDAYGHVREKNLKVTDEVSALQAIDRSVAIVANERPNLKITTPADLQIARALVT